jgi:disulfide bond formation protein DsbB
MEMTPFSLILSLGVLGILALTLVTFFGFIFSKKIREKLAHIPYFTYIKMIGLIAISATTLALTYQLYFELQVCILCWWQRIFIFPIDIVIIVSLWKKIRWNHLTTGILALIGLFFASYHYYFHFIGWVLKLPVYLPCEQGGLLPACTDHDGVLTFGFITIPFMAVCVLLAMVWLSYLAGRSKK